MGHYHAVWASIAPTAYAVAPAASRLPPFLGCGLYSRPRLRGHIQISPLLFNACTLLAYNNKIAYKWLNRHISTILALCVCPLWQPQLLPAFHANHIWHGRRGHFEIFVRVLGVNEIYHNLRRLFPHRMRLCKLGSSIIIVEIGHLFDQPFKDSGWVARRRYIRKDGSAGNIQFFAVTAFGNCRIAELLSTGLINALFTPFCLLTRE